MMKYYKVTAKCGHVGKNNYYEGELFVKADNGREAARIAREMPRVKHERKDAILNVIEIDFTSYVDGRKSVRNNPYFTCVNRQEQNSFWGEIENNVLVDEYFKEKDCKKTTKKHSLRNVYNVDPLYDLYRTRPSIFDYNET